MKLIGLTSRKLEGKVSIVTGAGAGIGHAIALRFAQTGSKVTAVDLNREALSETVKMIRDDGG
jgi:3-oxoacyl-[acyl-carrier protein] reductase